jgi:hypothetical protein
MSRYLANKQSIPAEQLVTMALSAQISSWITKDYYLSRGKSTTGKVSTSIS